MAIHVMDQYVSIDHYAQLCGLSRRAIMDRIHARSISAMKVDGYLSIHLASHPPKKDLRGKVKDKRGGIYHSHDELCCVVTWCNRKNIRSYPYLRAIITGKLTGYVIGEEVFANKVEMKNFRKEH